MNNIYMSVNITNYGNGMMACTYVESIDDESIQMKKLEPKKAYRLLWELVLAGGTREVRTNSYDPSITYLEAFLILRN